MDETTINEDFAKVIIARLEEIKTLTKTWFNTQEAADYAGCKVDTLRRYMYDGKLAYSKPTGGKVFISKKDLDEFLSSKRTPSQREVEARASDYIVSRQ